VLFRGAAKNAFLNKYSAEEATQTPYALAAPGVLGNSVKPGNSGRRRAILIGTSDVFHDVGPSCQAPGFYDFFRIKTVQHRVSSRVAANGVPKPIHMKEA
jgi:hypothetical protein